MLSLSRRRLGPVLISMLLPAAAWGQPPDGPAGGPEPYLRVSHADDDRTMTLEIASRTLERAGGGGPVVHLVGAVHVADAAFYRRVQEILDRSEVVLFEAVRPAGAGDGAPLDEAVSDERRAEMARDRLRFLATAVERFRAEHGRLPESIAALREGVRGKLRPMVGQSLIDPWGGPIRLRLESGEGLQTRFDLVSFGADGAAGGAPGTPDQDLFFSDQKPLTRAELGQNEGLQARLARALSLVYQMDGVDYDRPSWRNSDMSVDQIRLALGEDDEQARAVFGMLDGTSFMGRLAGVALALIEGNPRMAASMKAMLITTLSNAGAAMSQLGAGGARLMEVIIEERNHVVVRDLRSILEREPGVKDVAVFYGAGHMDHLERLLADELGYRPTVTRWMPAIRLDLREAGVTRRDLERMQESMRRMMERRRR
jgi:hypothetical protein